MARSNWYAIVWPYGVQSYSTAVGKPTAVRFTTEASRDEWVAGGPSGRRDPGYREAITGAEVRDHGLHPVPADEVE
jgi:hypothetical protein